MKARTEGGPRLVALVEIEAAAERLRRALAAVRRGLSREERKERALAALDAERALADLGGLRMLDPRGARPEVAVWGRDVEGRAGRVDRAGYGGGARGVALDAVRSLTPGQARTGRAFAALSELAASGGGGEGLTFAERLRVYAATWDAVSVTLTAADARRLADQLEGGGARMAAREAEVLATLRQAQALIDRHERELRRERRALAWMLLLSAASFALAPPLARALQGLW